MQEVPKANLREVEILADDELITIQLHRPTPSLEMIFKEGKGISSAAFRRYLQVYLLLYMQYRPMFEALNGIYDTRLLHALAPEDLSYAAEENTPQLYEAGLRYEAFIVPRAEIGQLSVNYYGRLTKGVEWRYFSSMREARAWVHRIQHA
ncbi:MAG: hypothetical protein LW884_11375 [Bacteroidetes bacterium]|jgi:hypothetical protein|nr:hypothetical protein [Bacteroidota bacterium]